MTMGWKAFFQNLIQTVVQVIVTKKVK